MKMRNSKRELPNGGRNTNPSLQLMGVPAPPACAQLQLSPLTCVTGGTKLTFGPTVSVTLSGPSQNPRAVLRTVMRMRQRTPPAKAVQP